MAKNFYGMMENSAKMYEAIKEHREKDYFPIVSIRKKDIYEVMSPKEVKKETALLVAAALQNDTRVEALIPNGDGKVKPEPVPVIGKGCDVKHLTKVKEGFYQKFLCNMGDPFAEKKEYEDTMEEVL